MLSDGRTACLLCFACRRVLCVSNPQEPVSKSQVKELLNLIYIVLTLTGSERAEYLFRALGFWSISLVQLHVPLKMDPSKTKADVQGVTTVRHTSRRTLRLRTISHSLPHFIR